MAKLVPFFFKISTDPKDPWYSLGCFHNVEEAFVAFKKKYGEKDVHLIRGKSYNAIKGKLMEN